MIKVFLVEDEVVMRNGIKNNIPWETEGFEFVGEASDGELAYPLIKKAQPDILLTDIKMPFMDGLELSRLVKKEFPRIKIILISGYNEFDYAKTAIGIGVTDYLLKPIGSVRLLEALRKVRTEIEKEREHSSILERYQKEMEENTLMEKHRLWSALAYNQLTTAELLESGHRLGMDFTALSYMVFLFKLMQAGDPNDCSQSFQEATECVTELSRKWKNVLVFDRSPEGWAFLIKGQSDEEVRSTWSEVKENLQKTLETWQEMEYYGGTGSIVHRLGDVRNSYLEASKVFAGRFFASDSEFMEYEQASALRSTRKEEKIDVSRLQSKKTGREQMERFLRSGTQEEIPGFLEEYFLGLGENFHSLLYRQYVIMDIYFSVTDFLSGLGMSVQDLPEKCRDINDIIALCSARDSSDSQVLELLGEIFSAALLLRDGHSKKKYSALLGEAKCFIQENYQREDMSLNTVAARVNISPSYFSALFSAEMGQTFVEYLTSVRLERAKELLMCSSMRTAEIGYEVGYKDSHYFSYIFKKVVGCSPKEYKNRRKEQV